MHTKIGSFQQFDHPKTALRLIKGDHTRSGHCGGKGKFICPVCGEVSDELEHGDAYECNGCHVKYQSYGNSLYIWGHVDIYMKKMEELKVKVRTNAAATLSHRSALDSLEREAQELLAQSDELKDAVLQNLSERTQLPLNYLKSRLDNDEPMDAVDYLIKRAKARKSDAHSEPEVGFGLESLTDRIKKWAESGDGDLVIVGIGRGIKLSKNGNE